MSTLSWSAGDLAVFLVTVAALVGLPGPNIVYICTRAAAGGRREGVVSALGVETGTLVHVVLATVGVSAVISASPALMVAIKVAGAAYLSYLALRILLARPGHGAGTADPGRSRLGRVYVDGLVGNLLNPKVVLFFLAFLPQFVPSGATAAQAREVMTGLGVVVVLVALVIDLSYAVAASALAARVTARGRMARGLRYVEPGVYLGMAALTVAAVSA